MSSPEMHTFGLVVDVIFFGFICWRFLTVRRAVLIVGFVSSAILKILKFFFSILASYVDKRTGTSKALTPLAVTDALSTPAIFKDCKNLAPAKEFDLNA